MSHVDRFTGHIAALGTVAGVRIVVGSWRTSPFGSFTDAMVELADGTRVLVAPSEEVSAYVAATYEFDLVRVEPVTLTRPSPSRWQVDSPSLAAHWDVGRPHPVSLPLALVPPRLRDAERWNRLLDPVASALMPGVRTHGSAGSGRTEWYAARSVHRIVAASARWEQTDLGPLADVWPPARFGFSSAPRRPALTRLTSHVRTSVAS